MGETAKPKHFRTFCLLEQAKISSTSKMGFWINRLEFPEQPVWNGKREKEKNFKLVLTTTAATAISSYE